MNREEAWALLNEYNKDPFHLEHGEIVGKTMRYFAEKLGYSDDEVKKLLEGKLPLFNEDIKDIAAFFNISESEMFKNYGDQAYNDAGCMHCMGDFINPENKELILDIFDQYCTLEECIE